MGFKPEPVQPDFSSLVTSLDNSRTQLTNYSLYQTVLFLIKNTARARELLVDDVATLDEQISGILAASFLTINNETNDFPNSRQLLAGLGITFDDTTPGERTINASSGVGYYDSPLTDGSEDETELIFADGDPIICQIPNVP